MASAGSVGCAPARIEVSDVSHAMGAAAWTATCAGVSYQCSLVADSNASCTSAGSSAEGPGVSSRAGHLADERRQEALLRRQGPRFEFSRDGETLRAVRATFQREVGALEFTYAPTRDRNTLRLSVAPAPRSATAEQGSACTTLLMRDGDEVLLRAEFEGAVALVPRGRFLELTQRSPSPEIELCGQLWVLSRADVYGFLRLRQYAAEALANAPPPAATAPETAGGDRAPAPATSLDASAALRARLNERAAVLRSCTEAPGSTRVVSIEATWDAEGQVQLRVRGVEDAAVHECAQVALGPWRAPAGEGGRLIHPLEAE
jgi:hypothetical protein